jgi:hypothetical protein
MRESGISSRLSFEVKQWRGRVNEKEPDMNTGLKEISRLREFQKEKERRSTQVSLAR